MGESEEAEDRLEVEDRLAATIERKYKNNACQISIKLFKRLTLEL